MSDLITAEVVLQCLECSWKELFGSVKVDNFGQRKAHLLRIIKARLQSFSNGTGAQFAIIVGSDRENPQLARFRTSKIYQTKGITQRPMFLDIVDDEFFASTTGILADDTNQGAYFIAFFTLEAATVIPMSILVHVDELRRMRDNDKVQFPTLFMGHKVGRTRIGCKVGNCTQPGGWN